ncbi:hypothetical protein K501DRAFT_283985 [Backusella circina FSU 941]|nr:hypothetical protein K501DRAFT_283985 [Backusella circina FSU 941]
MSSLDYVFLNLTCALDVEEEQDTHYLGSTHDYAESMLYAFVDNSESVADLLWTKQLLKQGEFLKLTDENEWPELSTITFSTHEPKD